MRCEPTSVRLMRDRLQERRGEGADRRSLRDEERICGQKHNFWGNSSCTIGAI